MSSFYIISGDDDFARKQRARECAIQLCYDPEPENCSAAEVIAGDEPTFKQEICSARFLESLRTPPFLCGRKLIWLRHHPDLDNFASDRPDEATAELLKLLREPLPTDIDVLIDGPGLDRRRTIFKDLKNAGFNVVVIEKGLAYVAQEGHVETLSKMREEGFKIQ